MDDFKQKDLKLTINNSLFHYSDLLLFECKIILLIKNLFLKHLFNSLFTLNQDLFNYYYISLSNNHLLICWHHFCISLKLTL